MNLREEAEKRVDAKIKFQENLFKYLIVNIIIAAISFVFLHSFWLLAVVMFFWGIEVVDDFLNAYSLNNHREKMIQNELSGMGD
ncbi:MAG: 2TM domain-containing protein [Methanobrevibacter sp.]|uniref:2TM domain-containing protein n=1 Tax=Methanobrevibacter sp. TaxID=66852 RepID=UPI0025E18281|nr:2TM domain-containing protein [Methanobrevibacter sp.]MBE6508054.1 2TM domain-containing protein [Methanobrevibacter sp.]